MGVFRLCHCLISQQQNLKERRLDQLLQMTQRQNWTENIGYKCPAVLSTQLSHSLSCCASTITVMNKNYSRSSAIPFGSCGVLCLQCDWQMCARTRYRNLRSGETKLLQNILRHPAMSAWHNCFLFGKHCHSEEMLNICIVKLNQLVRFLLQHPSKHIEVCVTKISNLITFDWLQRVQFDLALDSINISISSQ